MARCPGACLADWLLTLLAVSLFWGGASATKIFYIHWNTTNPIFQISNTDHIIDVNKGNNLFEYDQVTIICPSYSDWIKEEDTEKYIIYNVSKEEYDTCRITNPNPRIIAVCDKPYKVMFFTITFRSFTPQPGGLEFRPGQDYFFISTSARGDMLRRIGGRCSTHNMKVVFKVCCNETEQNHIAEHSPAALPGPGVQHPPLSADEPVPGSTPPAPAWLPPRTTSTSSPRPTTRHSYKGVYDPFRLHVPTINVKAATEKQDEYDKKKHPNNNNVAKNEGLKSAAAALTASCLDSCAAAAVSIAGFLLLRLVPG